MPTFKKIKKEWWKTILFGILVVLLAIALRLYNLDLLPVFVDEAIYIRWAQIMRTETTLRFLPLSDGKQPLFMWMVIPFFKIFSDPLLAGRFVSTLTGTGTVVGVFTASYLLFKSKKTALAASFVYAISPFAVFFDRMALVDSMLTFFGIWVFVGLILISKFKRLDHSMITGFALGGALLTKSPALFFVLLLPSSYYLTVWRKNKKVSGFVKLTGLLFVVLAIGYGMFNILRLGPNFHLLGTRNYDYVHPYSHILENPLDPFLPFSNTILKYFWVLGPSTLLLLVVLGMTNGFKKYKKEMFIVLVWGVLPILAISEFSKTMTARYVLFTLPFFAILAGRGIESKKKIVEKVLLAGFLFFTIHSFYINKLFLTDIEAAPLPRSERNGYLEEWTAGTGIKKISIYLKEEANNLLSGEQIVVGTEGYFGTLPDGLQMYLNDTPEIIVIGVGLGIKEVPESLVESRDFGNKTYLVINSSRLTGDPKKMGLELLDMYPKAFRPVGTVEYKEKGPQEILYLFRVK